MRKLLGYIFIILLISCEKPPQDSVTLKILYQPETSYKFSSEQTLATVITYSGKQTILQELKRRGHKNPTILNKKSSTEAMIKTGKPEDENTRFPVKAEYASVITNNGKIEAPVNVIFHGKCLKDSIPVFDLAVADGLDRDSKMVLLESWQKSLSQLSFKGEKLKIGEELIIQTPLSIPMEGSEIDMTVKTRYRLISIKEDMANLDIAQEYTLNPKLMDNSFQGTGIGQGRMVYDMENSTVVNYTLDTQMELTKKLDSFEFHLKTNSHLVQKTSLVGNSK